MKDRCMEEGRDVMRGGWGKNAEAVVCGETYVVLQKAADLMALEIL